MKTVLIASLTYAFYRGIYLYLLRVKPLVLVFDPSLNPDADWGEWVKA